MSRSPNSVDRFDGRSSDYAKFRPSYPSGAIDAILEGLGDPHAVAAVDAGAGTGISLALLAERGVRATGLEPNAGMRERATRLGLTVNGGTVLDNDLPKGSFDLVTAFQAYHWFADVPSTLALASLLHPDGRIALVWNLFDRTDPFTDAFCELLDRFADPYRIAGLGYDRAARANAVHAIPNMPSSDPQIQSESGHVTGSVIGAALVGGGFTNLRMREVPYVQALDEGSLLGRLRSSSSAPTSGPEYDAMAAALHTIVERFASGAPDGEYPLAHRTHVILGELPLSPPRG